MLAVKTAAKSMGGFRAERGGEASTGQTYTANGDVLLASFLQNLRENTLLLELEVHLGLVGLDLDQHLTRGNRIAGFLLPSTNVARRHGRGQGGHLNDSVRRVRSIPPC